MIAVVQRVSSGSVSVNGNVTGEIASGLVVLLGVAADDDSSDAAWLAEKIVNLRIFEDARQKMNFSLAAVSGKMLVVSQFTLLGDCSKGRRPSFVGAASPDRAEELYHCFIERVQSKGIPVQTGVFQAMMDVAMVNQGPVTVIIDSKK